MLFLQRGADKLANHLSLRIYPNKDYVVNVVSDMNLANHIEYNRFYRPGCILYIDGVRKSDGCLKKSCLKEYDEYANALAQTLDISLARETTPFR